MAEFQFATGQNITDLAASINTQYGDGYVPEGSPHYNPHENIWYQRMRINRPMDVLADKPMHTLQHIYSHDFCRPSTWYQESEPAQDSFTATASQDTHVLAEATPIWLKGRRIMNSHLITEYDFVVTVDGVQQTEQDYVHHKNLFITDSIAEDWSTVPGDYRYDQDTNSIIFKTPLSGGESVTIDYHRVDPAKLQRSRFRLQPPAGYYYKISAIEIDFSTDIILRDTAVFQLWAAGGNALQMDKRYFIMDNYRADSVRPNPVTGACGGPGPRGMSQDGQTFTWDYISAFPIYSSAAMWLDMFLEHDEPFGGDNATVTLYTQLIPE